MYNLTVSPRRCVAGVAAVALVTAAAANYADYSRSRAGNAESRVPFSRVVSAAGSEVAVGGAAPSITWTDAQSGSRKSLTDLRGKPVVLFFGSYTCPPFRIASGMIEQLWKRYQDRIHGLLVYSKEAHPRQARVDHIRNMKTLADRERAARELLAESGLSMPVLVDAMDNPAEKACGSIPSRILVIDSQGRIAYASAYPSSQMAMPVASVLEQLLASDAVSGESAVSTAKNPPDAGDENIIAHPEAVTNH